MQTRPTRALVLGLAGLMAVTAGDAALARSRKHHHERHARSAAVRNDLGITRDYDGTPIIMQGFHRTRLPPQEGERRAVHIPRGSSTYIPPVNPSPGAANSPPSAVLTQPPPPPYKPPAINSFSDRVTNCIHSFPLQGGVGNNPSDQQMYIRQCANQ